MGDKYESVGSKDVGLANSIHNAIADAFGAPQIVITEVRNTETGQTRDVYSWSNESVGEAIEKPGR